MSVLDCPKGIVCRVRTSQEYEIPRDAASFSAGVIPILKLVLKAKVNIFYASFYPIPFLAFSFDYFVLTTLSLSQIRLWSKNQYQLWKNTRIIKVPKNQISSSRKIKV